MPIQYHKLAVLVADDFSSFRSTVNGMLLNLGVERITAASNGEEAIEKCERMKFDVILSDYDLGSGRNGQHVLEELRHRKLIDWNTVYIMVSAEASRNIVMSAYDCEPDDYLMKPITAQMLQRRMERQLILRDKMRGVHTALNEGERQTAVDRLIDLSLAEDRYSVTAQKMLGEIFLENGELNKAEKLYTKALEVRQLEWARLGLAKVKQKMGELDTASVWLHRIVDENPLFLPAYDVLADNWEQLGDASASQEVVQKAVDVSPMSILRQKRLAGIAENNGDLLTAIDAHRKTVRLGKLSCHGAPEDNFAFAKAVTQAKIENVELPHNIYKEAIEIVDNANNAYELSHEEMLEAQALTMQVKDVERGILPTLWKKEDTIFEGLGDKPSKPSVSHSIDEDIEEVVELFDQGKDELAQKRLHELKVEYEDDETALKRLDQFFDEPVSESNQALVSGVNREGISLYSDGRFDDALACFEKARKLFPKHVGIQLNIAQCLIGKLKVEPDNGEIFDKCEQALDIVESQVGEFDPQYDRYARLRRLSAATHRKFYTGNTSIHSHGAEYE